jgi:hypothetical protein
MGRLKPEVQSFVEQVKAELHSYGFRLYFGRGKTVNGGGWRAVGYFCDRRREIRVARARSDWLDILIHEYAHFRQWVEQPACVYNADARASTVVDGYLHRKRKVAPGLLRKAFARVMAFERDAEMRAVAIAKAKGLPVDPKNYIRHANLYIYSHHLMRDTGKWKAHRSPHQSWKIVQAMPSDFKARPHRSIPRPVYALLARCYDR